VRILRCQTCKDPDGEEQTNCIFYQVGALTAFLAAEGVPLNRIKPRGALQSMPARGSAVADAADFYCAPLPGLPGTAQESVYRERGHRFFAYPQYDDDGTLIITRDHPPLSPTMPYGGLSTP
jgi:UPF0271 protein